MIVPAFGPSLVGLCWNALAISSMEKGSAAGVDLEQC